MSLLPYDSQINYADEKGKNSVWTRLIRFLTRFLLPEKIQQFLSKFEGAADDVVEGFDALGLQDDEVQRKPKYMEQLVGQGPC